MKNSCRMEKRNKENVLKFLQEKNELRLEWLVGPVCIVHIHIRNHINVPYLFGYRVDLSK